MQIIPEGPRRQSPTILYGTGLGVHNNECLLGPRLEPADLCQASIVLQALGSGEVLGGRGDLQGVWVVAPPKLARDPWRASGCTPADACPAPAGFSSTAASQSSWVCRAPGRGRGGARLLRKI